MKIIFAALILTTATAAQAWTNSEINQQTQQQYNQTMDNMNRANEQSYQQQQLEVQQQQLQLQREQVQQLQRMAPPVNPYDAYRNLRY